ncbi:MAG: hypothetical protein FWG30_12060 [Eubacteriaceae bacterium]|nr:hypothetical protein [Eubacteriaceae bacterium]
MALFSDVGAVPAVQAWTGGRDDEEREEFWIFAILFLFVVLILAFFFWGKDDRRKNEGYGADALLPLAAMQMANQPKHYDDGYGKAELERWDINRDVLKGFGDQRYEFAKGEWELSRQIGETRYDTLKQTYEASKQIGEVKYDLSKEHTAQYYALEKGQDTIKAEIAREIACLRSEIDRNRIADLERQLTVAQLKDHTGDSYPYRPAYVCEPAPYC